MSKKKTRITLSPFGRTIETVEPTFRAAAPPTGGAPPTPPMPPQFDWKNAVLDGFIIAMITFFTTLGGVTATGANVTTIVVSSTISAVAQFFVLIAVKRGIQAPTKP